MPLRHINPDEAIALGAAVAAGMGAIAHGNDLAGSVRYPAYCTGVAGLRPSFGRVPAWPPSMTGDLSNTGPMARTALDAALMMNAIARPDPRDGHALRRIDWPGVPDAGDDFVTYRMTDGSPWVNDARTPEAASC